MEDITKIYRATPEGEFKVITDVSEDESDLLEIEEAERKCLAEALFNALHDETDYGYKVLSSDKDVIEIEKFISTLDLLTTIKPEKAIIMVDNEARLVSDYQISPKFKGLMKLRKIAINAGIDSDDQNVVSEGTISRTLMTCDEFRAFQNKIARCYKGVKLVFASLTSDVKSLTESENYVYFVQRGDQQTFKLVCNDLANAARLTLLPIEYLPKKESSFNGEIERNNKKLARNFVAGFSGQN